MLKRCAVFVSMGAALALGTRLGSARGAALEAQTAECCAACADATLAAPAATAHLLARAALPEPPAGSETQRSIAEESARLAELEGRIRAVRERHSHRRSELAALRDSVLGWQRRTREAKSQGVGAADVTYVALRKALRAARDELDATLDGRTSDALALPRLDAATPDDVPNDVVLATEPQRRGVEALLDETLADEQVLEGAQAAALRDAITVLNRERLELLSHLSAEERRSVTGLSAAGVDQARSELYQLLLILRFDQRALADWISALRRGDGAAQLSPWRLMFGALPYLLAALVFAWWRRRSSGWLAGIDAGLEALEREARRGQPSAWRELLALLQATHRPLEWLIFAAVVVWLLPARVYALLEVQLLIVTVGWTLAGAAIVNAINALASRGTASVRASDALVAELRLCSLRLIGRVVVAFALALFIAARLLGRGTVHHWVASSCWIAVVPIAAVLIARWKSEIFARVERRRKKSPLTRWVLAHQRGWRGFVAAAVGVAQLVWIGGVDLTRRHVAALNVARHAHAYLFRRELDRMTSGGGSSSASSPLDAEALASLHPARQGARWLPSPADEVLEALVRRARAGRGGLVAVVGGRGAGKSSLLARLAAELGDAQRVDCQALDGDLTSVAREPSALLLLDNAQALVRPVLGGLAQLDEVMSLARARCHGSLWVFGIDGLSWPFLSRARDARALFDEVRMLAPWGDEAIGALLSARSAEAGVTPSFEDLLDRLPASADELDRREAHDEKRAGYFRMVWDYARGNPGMALEVWRDSLLVDASGQVRVRPLRAPPATELEALPDAGLFVLRAILMMAPASVSDVAEATRLSEAEVRDAFGYGRAHGFLIEEGGRVSVGWEWLRSVLLLLERRHLVLSS